MKRRNFLKLSASASVLSLTPFELQAALKTLTSYLSCADVSNRKLVLINLAGANDGLNSIIPINQYDTYSNLRPTIKVSSAKYITLDNTLPENQQIGLNPGLASFKSLYDKGWLRILQSVGYPSQNKSHFKSTDLYLTGNDGNSRLNGEDTGWIGRFMESYYAGLVDETFPLAVEIGSNKTSLGFHTEEAVGLSLNITGQDPSGFYSVLNGLGGAVPTNIPNSDYGKQLAFINGTGMVSNTYAESVSSAFNSGQNNATYPDTDLANQLKTVARLISGDLGSKIYMVRISGFDTHNSQVQGAGEVLGKHYELLTELSGAIEAFMSDINNQNIADDVVGITFSEFGRKARENGSFGTDHGEIAPMFVFGKPIAGGVSGTNPDLTEASNTNNWQIQTVQHDYRQTFATLLQNFLGADNAIIDATFFNHTINNSFTNLKLDELLKSEFKVSSACFGGTLATQTPNEIKNWLIYPNPFSKVINISGIENINIITYNIYNSAGKLILNSSGQILNGKLSLDLAYLTSGVYFFEIIAEGKKERHKVLKV